MRRPYATTLALLAFAAASCASNPPPESVASQEAAATAAAAARTEAESIDRREREEKRAQQSEPVREKIVVVDRGGSSRTPSPGELAAATREERRRHGDRSVAALTDENLSEYAARGKVTISGTPLPEEGEEGEGEGEAGEEGATAAAAAASDALADEPCDEPCWRRRARELRQAWRDTADSIEELEAEVAEQRWKFYATDDPWVRDTQIKPAWDRALDQLRTARDEAERYGERVDELMQQGRRAG
ncbi:MAG TPA: hypothetical protein VKU40_18620, partial [Thermoanaerobaculia bacterium]|nr:hypothetical protein [Thermoanaerobaculia bacterium]